MPVYQDFPPLPRIPPLPGPGDVPTTPQQPAPTPGEPDCYWTQIVCNGHILRQYICGAPTAEQEQEAAEFIATYCQPPPPQPQIVWNDEQRAACPPDMETVAGISGQIRPKVVVENGVVIVQSGLFSETISEGETELQAKQRANARAQQYAQELFDELKRAGEIDCCYFSDEQCYLAECPPGTCGMPVEVCAKPRQFSSHISKEDANAHAYSWARTTALNRLVCMNNTLVVMRNTTLGNGCISPPESTPSPEPVCPDCVQGSAKYPIGDPVTDNCFQMDAGQTRQIDCTMSGWKAVQAWKNWHGTYGFLHKCQCAETIPDDGRPCSGQPYWPGTGESSVDTTKYLKRTARYHLKHYAHDSGEQEHNAGYSVTIGRHTGNRIVEHDSDSEQNELYYREMEVDYACDRWMINENAMMNMLITKCWQNGETQPDGSKLYTREVPAEGGIPGIYEEISVLVTNTKIEVHSYYKTWNEWINPLTARWDDLTITLSEPYTSDDVWDDVKELLAQWNDALQHPLWYPWRRDGNYDVVPLVTRDEQAPTYPSAAFAGESSVESYTGAILGRPLPLVVSNTPVYWEPVWDWRHPDSSGGGVRYGKARPAIVTHAATQWTDSDLAQAASSTPVKGAWAAFVTIVRDMGDPLCQSPYSYELPPLSVPCLNCQPQRCNCAGTLAVQLWVESLSYTHRFRVTQWDYDYRDFGQNRLLVRQAQQMSGCAVPPAPPVLRPYTGPLKTVSCQLIERGRDKFAVVIAPYEVSWRGFYSVVMNKFDIDGEWGNYRQIDVHQKSSPPSCVCGDFITRANNGLSVPMECYPPPLYQPVTW